MRGRGGGGGPRAGRGHSTAGQPAPDAAAAAAAAAYGSRASAPRSGRGDIAGGALPAPGQVLLQAPTALSQPQTPHQSQATAAASAPEAVSLVDANWGFDAAAAAKLLSGSGGDFRVVGLLGCQGAGKSALASALMMAMGDWAGGPQPPPGTAGAAAAAAARAVGRAVGGAFQDARSAPGPVCHGTSRLELRVQPTDRTLVLDSPPLWSASWASELASLPEPPLMLLRGSTGSAGGIMARAIADARSCGMSSLPAEGVSELLGLQLGALMLAACHVVVLMVDAVDEPRLWEYLQVIDMAAHCLPDVGSAAAAAAAGAVGGGGGIFGALQAPGLRRVAELVVVMTGLSNDQLTVRHLRPQAELLRLALAATRLLPPGVPQHPQLPGSGSGTAGRTINVLRFLGEGDDGGAGPQSQRGAEADGGAAGGADAGRSGRGGGGSLHFWALPRGWQQKQQPSTTTGYDMRPPPPPALLAPLRAALLGIARRPLALGSPYPAAVHPHHHPSAHHSLSEREWLRGLERLWEVELQRCVALEHYYLARQRSAFAGGGGWPVGSGR